VGDEAVKEREDLGVDLRGAGCKEYAFERGLNHVAQVVVVETMGFEEFVGEELRFNRTGTLKLMRK